MPAKIFAPAEARLLEIWDYTVEKWGEEQADTYVHELLAAIDALPDHRLHWRPVADKSLRGVWFLRHRHHYIFFRELPAGGGSVRSAVPTVRALAAEAFSDDNTMSEFDLLKWNTCKDSYGERAVSALSMVEGKSLTYRDSSWPAV